jgi:hypothetical protein
MLLSGRHARQHQKGTSRLSTQQMGFDVELEILGMI